MNRSTTTPAYLHFDLKVQTYEYGKGEMYDDGGSEVMAWFSRFSAPSDYRMGWLSENRPGPTYLVGEVDLEATKKITGDLVLERAHYALKDWVRLELTVTDGFSQKTDSHVLERGQPLDWAIDIYA